jgi:uncharacterized protein (DUF697 family)
LAAFADGEQKNEERAEIRRIAGGFPGGPEMLAGLIQDVLLGRVTLAQAVQPLVTRETRLLAHELAVCLCEADDVCSAAEARFLEELRAALELDPQAVTAHREQADALALTPLAAAAADSPPPTPAATDAELDRTILNHALLAGALELLPDALATMAIVPLQMKLVYGIGRHYGHRLDRGHIKEFLATAGLGLTSQVLEQYVTRLARGLFGRVAGGFGRMLAGQAASSAMSFATTYALGQAARRYYAGGRRLDASQLRELFNQWLGQGQALQARYLPAIQEKSRSLNPRALASLIRSV